MVYKSSFSNFLKPSYFNYSFIEIFFSILLSFLLLISSYFYKNKSYEIRRVLINFFSPISSFISLPANKIGFFIDKIDYFFELNETNKKLEKQILNYKEQLNQMYSLKVENYNLKNLLNLKAPPASDKITARIIVDPSSFSFSHIFIDVGKDENVKLNNPVFNENGLLGRVVNVNKNTSEVLLITDNKSNLPVLSSESNQKFFVEGNTNFLEIKHLEDKGMLNHNESIMTTDASGYFKEGILVGNVVRNDGEVFVVPAAKKSDSIFVKILIYNYSKQQPEFELE